MNPQMSPNRSGSDHPPPAGGPVAKKLRRNVEFRTPDLVHRLIAVVPLGYGAWCLANGQDVPPLFWWLVGATVLFHMLVRCTPYVRLTPGGLQLPQEDDRNVLWTELRECRNTTSAMNLLLGTGEQVRIDYSRLRRRDVARLRAIVRQQCMALAAEAKAALERGEVFGPASTARI